MNLTRFKIAGNLPSLHVNLSDSKYKALMRLIDVCVPKFDDMGHKAVQPTAPPQHNLPTFQIPVGLFGSASPDLDVEDQEPDGEDEDGNAQNDIFFEAEENPQTVSPLPTVSKLLTPTIPSFSDRAIINNSFK